MTNHDEESMESYSRCEGCSEMALVDFSGCPPFLCQKCKKEERAARREKERSK